jgi:NACHT domain
VVSFVADDLAAWLVALLADSGRKKLASWLAGDEQERALRQAATAAVQSAAADLCAGDQERADEQALVISHVFGTVMPQAPLQDHQTLLEALQAGVAAQLTVLDNPSITGTGMSSAQVLGVATEEVAARLAGHLVREIIVRGSRGGPLGPLAEQLNHDRTHVQGHRIERILLDLQEMLNGLPSGQARPAAPPGLAGNREQGIQGPGQTSARELTSAYRRGLNEFYRHGLHELVPLPLVRDGSPVTPYGLADALREAGHVQLTGPSGCGKTHLVRHILLGLDDNMLPVLVEGGMYEGQLSAQIDRSVARFMAGSGQELLDAAAITGQAVILVIDGFNECPQPRRSRLVDDLMALSLRARPRTLITAHSVIDLPRNLTGTVVEAAPLTSEDRRAVLRSYAAEDLEPLCEPFSTAFELSVAAECSRELGALLNRGKLFASFTRKRLSTSPAPTLVRGALRQVALAMDDRLTTWLPVDETVQISEEYLVGQGASAAIADEVLRCSIVRADQGKVSFTHELLGRFLAMEGLRQAHPEPGALAWQLRLPRYEDLPPLALDLETDPERAGVLLSAMADMVLYFLALSGSYGHAARKAAETAARDLLQAATMAMTETVFTFHDIQLTVTGGRRLTESDQSLLAAIGALTHEGRYLPEVTALLDATDTACQRSADIQEAAEGQRPSAWSIGAALHGFISDAHAQVAASIVLRSASWAPLYSRLRQQGRPQRAAAQEMVPVLRGATPASWGRLLLLAGHLRGADDNDSAAMALSVLRLCRDSGSYHVQLGGLHMIETFASAVEGDPLREEIIDTLRSFGTDDFMLNTSLAEAWDAYGLIEANGDADFVRRQIDQVLASPASAESRTLAYGLVASQFEDVIAEPYCEAIGSLPPDQKTALYTLAVLGSPSYGAWNDVLLSDLVQSGDATALPAFQRWATQLDIDNPVVQEVAQCYVLAMQGCAQFMTEPPELPDSQDGDRAAWGCYGAIIFWLTRPGVDRAEVTEKCAPYWQRLSTTLLTHAADPLTRMATAVMPRSGRRVLAVRPILATFPDQIRPILEWSLKHSAERTSLFRGNFDGDSLGQVISMLAVVGNASTSDLLRTYIDDPRLGTSAIAAIKSLAVKQDTGPGGAV